MAVLPQYYVLDLYTPAHLADLLKWRGAEYERKPVLNIQGGQGNMATEIIIR